MLILSRKRGQSIVINNEIEIYVTAIEGDQVKIGIAAPKELTVLRKEVWEEVRTANNQSLLNDIDYDGLQKWYQSTVEKENK